MVTVLFVGVLPACTLFTSFSGLHSDTAGSDAGVDVSGQEASSVDAAAGADGDGNGVGPSCGGAVGPIKDLVAYYPLDEGSGLIARDCSGQGHNGQILRLTPTTWTNGKRGGGLLVRAAGGEGCIDLGTGTHFEFVGAFTVMAWVAMRSYPTSGTMAIVGKSSDIGAAGWRLHTAPTNELGAGVAQPSDTLYVGREAEPADAWHHVAAIFTPTVSLELYVDGQRVSNRSWGSALIEDKNAALRIGCRGDDTGFIDGIVDEVRLYSRALTPAEIAILSSP